jgi:hypothetical protein
LCDDIHKETVKNLGYLGEFHLTISRSWKFLWRILCSLFFCATSASHSRTEDWDSMAWLTVDYLMKSFLTITGCGKSSGQWKYLWLSNSYLGNLDMGRPCRVRNTFFAAKRKVSNTTWFNDHWVPGRRETLSQRRFFSKLTNHPITFLRDNSPLTAPFRFYGFSSRIFISRPSVATRRNPSQDPCA